MASSLSAPNQETSTKQQFDQIPTDWKKSKEYFFLTKFQNQVSKYQNYLEQNIADLKENLTKITSSTLSEEEKVLRTNKTKKIARDRFSELGEIKFTEIKENFKSNEVLLTIAKSVVEAIDYYRREKNILLTEKADLTLVEEKLEKLNKINDDLQMSIYPFNTFRDRFDQVSKLYKNFHTLSKEASKQSEGYYLPSLHKYVSTAQSYMTSSSTSTEEKKETPKQSEGYLLSSLHQYASTAISYIVPNLPFAEEEEEA